MISRFTLVLLLITSVSFAQQNTIILIADDVSPDYFGFYTNQDTAITPNLSSLAANGLVFNRAWAYPICSPTRASIFTGRYGFRTGIGAVVTGPTSNQLSLNETSLADILRTQAYGTACVGKWHLHSQQGNLNNPNIMGYQYYSGNFSGGLTDYSNYQKVTNGTISTNTTYSTTTIINDAISWLDTLAVNQPFFLWVAFNAPHSPFHKPPNNLITNTSLPGTTAHINNNPAEYFKAAIEALDTETGRLIQYLSSKGKLDSTNFIFIGDNGSPSEVTKNPVNNQSKGTIYNYGVEIPMFISGPAVVAPNRRTNEMVSTVDLFATIAQLSGVANWNPNAVVQDTRSLWPLIKNQSQTVRGYQYSEQFGTNGRLDGKSIRNLNYHLLRFDSTGDQALYNLITDTFETTNLLLNPATLSAADIANYHLLCDSMAVLTGSNTCLPLAAQHFDLEAAHFQIFPNPANTLLQIASDIKITALHIYDGQGKTILHEKGEDLKEINIQNLSKGFYYLQINQGILKPFSKY